MLWAKFYKDSWIKNGVIDVKILQYLIQDGLWTYSLYCYGSLALQITAEDSEEMLYVIVRVCVHGLEYATKDGWQMGAWFYYRTCLKNEERKPKQTAQFWPLNIS